LMHSSAYSVGYSELSFQIHTLLKSGYDEEPREFAKK
jgi:hypothetical protein